MTFAQPTPEPPRFSRISSHLIKFKKMLAAAGLLLCLAAVPVQANDAVVEGKSNWLFAGWESLTTAKPDAEKASLRLISETAALFAEKNIKLIVVVVPLKPRYYEALLPDGAAMSDLVRGRYDRLLTGLRAGGIKAPDVRDALRTVLAGKKKEVFYRTDFHWTTFAAEATADLVADVMTTEGPLPGKPGSGAPLGEWMSDRHLGDLAANFLSPERKRAIGPEAYVIRAAAPPAAGLLDPDPSPVAVVGNSFMQPYFGFPQRLSYKIDRPVALKWNPGDVGPWATLLQYLQSTEFATASVRYLVWQFNEAQIQNGPDAVGEWAPQSISDRAAWRAKVADALKNR